MQNWDAPDNIASEVANLQIENPLGASANSVRTATVNISPGSEDKFRTQIRTIKDCVNKLLKSSLENSESIEDFVNKLITDLSTFKGKTPNLDFTYPLISYENLQKQRLTFNKKTPKNRELLKVHKLTISVQKTRDFDAELRKGLEKYMKVKFAGASSAEKEDLEYSLLVVPIANNTLEETYQMRLADIANYANEELWRNMQQISHRKSYPESLRFAIKDAIELVNKLRDGLQKTQRLEQNSQHLDQYYAFPLFAFISGDVMSEYFANEPEEPEDQSFRDILAIYIRLLYPVGNILPIGHKYQDFPFVVFRSYSLQ